MAVAEPVNPDLTADIRALYQDRRFAMAQRKRLTLSLGAYLRMQMGWSKALPEAERKAIAAQAARLIDLGGKFGRGQVRSEDLGEWVEVILAAIHARSIFDTIEADTTRRLAALGRELPAWAWAKPIRGFGALSLAVIVAEAGDLAGYPTVAKLWKRLGLAVIAGVRQGGLAKSAGAAEWIAHGYNRERRSAMWNIGESLVKQNGAGPYRAVYLARKAYERERAEAAGLIVAPAAKIPARDKAAYISLGQIDARAKRYMTKRLLKHLWQAWRRGGG